MGVSASPKVRRSFTMLGQMDTIGFSSSALTRIAFLRTESHSIKEASISQCSTQTQPVKLDVFLTRFGQMTTICFSRSALTSIDITFSRDSARQRVATDHTDTARASSPDASAAWASINSTFDCRESHVKSKGGI